MIFICSDTHFNHANIIKYCNRPFATVDEMNSALIAGWNAIVHTEDTVYFLGDFALGPKEAFRRFSQCLNGHKHFIFGNHDHISATQILECGWESCQYKIDLEYEGQKVHMEHHPRADIADDTVLIYGHVHDKPALNLPHKSFCACVERTHYMPVSLEYVLENLDLKI